MNYILKLTDFNKSILDDLSSIYGFNYDYFINYILDFYFLLLDDHQVKENKNLKYNL